jgi:hypothetical protein
MKYLLAFCIFFLPLISLSQEIKKIEDLLIQSFSKIKYWSTPDRDLTGDSLIKANDDFQKLLLKYTAKNKETLTYPFKNLNDSGLSIHTSKDKKFRIYSWDTWTGGTMHFYRNVFQFKGAKAIHSKTIPSYFENNEDGPDCTYHSLSDLQVGQNTYYITLSIMVGSSAIYYHTAKIFSINGDKLNDTVKLIKTKSGIKNEIGYEIDLHHADISEDRDKMYPGYDEAKQEIILPLVDGNGRVTWKKIIYKFRGSYFQKI